MKRPGGKLPEIDFKKIRVTNDDCDRNRELLSQPTLWPSAASAASSSASSSSSPGSAAIPTGHWKREGTLMWLDYPSLRPLAKAPVVSFDLDSTLVGTRSGMVFADGPHDWKWLFPEVPQTLRKLHQDGNVLVIFSNQAGVGLKGLGFDSVRASEFTGRVDNILKDLGIPVFVFASSETDRFRKPCTGMWSFMVKTIFGGVSPDVKACKFVGDAAGRPAGWKPGRKKDFSCSDRKFAHNLGVEFLTPEEFFLKEPAVPFEWGGFNPKTCTFSTTISPDGATSFHSENQEIVLMCGFPGCGKTTFAKRYLIPHNYAHVNRDTLKTPKKCLETARTALRNGLSVVVDNTLPKFKSDDKDKCNGRDVYVQLGKTYGVPVRVFRFMASEDLALHLNYFRERLTQGKERHVPNVAYVTHKKNFQAPKPSEGYSEIREIHFVPHFDDPKVEAQFQQMA
eukprot:RCo037470